MDIKAIASELINRENNQPVDIFDLVPQAREEFGLSEQQMDALVMELDRRGVI